MIEPQLYGITATNPRGLVLATAAIVSVCLAASAVPAWRIANTDPREAFEAE